MRYLDPDGRERSKSFRLRKDAEAFRRTVESEMLRGSYIAPERAAVTFRKYAEQWVAGRPHKPTTAALYRSHFDRHILPVFGDRQLSSIRRTEVQAWVRKRCDVLAPTTVQTAYGILATVFKAAIVDGLVVSTPCVGIALPKVQRGQVRALERAQLARLIEAPPDRYRAMFIAAAGLGMRQGELFGLRASNIDFLRRRVRVVEQLVLLPGAPPFLAPPKSSASIRTVPLPSVVAEALAEHMRAYPPHPDGFLFTEEDGGLIRRTSFHVLWRKARDAAGLSSETVFHTLRHTYASLLIEAGEHPKAIQTRLGHASITETMDTYGHLFADSEDRTRDAIDAALGHLPVEGSQRGIVGL